MKNYTYKRISLTLLLLTLFSGMIWAQIPNGYYDSAEGKTGQELRMALHNIIKDHTSRGYSSLGDYFGYTDLDENQLIIDIYSNQHYTLNQTGSASGNTEGNGWNKEHTWPQSWLNGTAKSDIFHIYPTDATVNGKRSNHPYAKVKDPATWTSSNGCKLGTSKTPGYSGTAFEPADEYKGDLARTYFYISTRYYTEDSNWGSSAMTNKCEIEPWAMKMLLEWSDNDPVSQKEIDRNNAIYNIVQFNRNPFIDHPEYAHMIWDENWSDGTYYDITCATGLEHGTVSASTDKAFSGTTVTLTATPDEGYMLHSWHVYKTGNENIKTTVENNKFIMPAYNVTVSATFALDAGEVGNGDFVKVTTTPADWSGTYLIVYESEEGNFAFDGSLEHLDASSDTQPVEIADDAIASTNDNNAITFTIQPMEGGYSICSASGKYIGRSANSNGMDESDTPLLNTITMDGSEVAIVGTGGAHLRYNKSNGQERFRYFKSSTYTGQQPIQLYKKTAAPADVTFTITPMSIEPSTMTNVIYDLQGRHIHSPLKKGIYISNGKKIIIK